MTTYKISSPVGPLARWLPSIEAAKERYQAIATESDFDAPDPIPKIAFVDSSTDPDDGEPCTAHVQCFVNGDIDACIWPELPEWPHDDYARHGKSPDLVMVRGEASTVRFPRGPSVCPHSNLTCTLSNDVPRIVCPSCGAQWIPETP